MHSSGLSDPFQATPVPLLSDLASHCEVLRLGDCPAGSGTYGSKETSETDLDNLSHHHLVPASAPRSLGSPARRSSPCRASSLGLSSSH